MRQRDQITSLMTYFKNTIRDHIPEWEKVEQPGAPLHVISTRNGWDLGKLKEEIQERVGGVWFVGAVNVGKSSLLREVWPEGGLVRDATIADAAEFDILPDPETLNAFKKSREYVNDEAICSSPEDRDPSLEQILNQARHSGEEPVSSAVQVAPAISDVPGTTMAPIRVGYKTKGRGGKFRGEIVDLPGIERWCGFPEHGLMKYVRPEVRKEVPMKKRPLISQLTVKPG